MNTGLKLGAYGLILAAALGGGAVVGAAIGPDESDDATPAHDAHGDAPTTTVAADADGGHETGAAAGDGNTSATSSPPAPGGVVASNGDYTFQPARTVLGGAAGDPFEFQIVAADGSVVDDYEMRHERELHLIVVSTDLATFHHLHPQRNDDGTWSTTLPRLAPGTYRAYADFAAAGDEDVTLGVLLTVPGDAAPRPLPHVDVTSDGVDGYDVTLEGTPQPGTDSTVTLAVERNGRPVNDLEPYLGAKGHLVAIRDGDLAYLHVHPLDETASAGNTVEFAVEIPTTGTYRLFFEFAHDGSVHAADFTLDVRPGDDEGASHDGSGTTESHEHEEEGDG